MIDFLSDDIRRNPFPIYDQLRGSSPVLPVPQADLWMVFDYEGVERVLSDHDAFSSDLQATVGHPTPQWFIFFDPPRHAKLRGLIMRAFTPRMIANLEPRIRVLSRQLLDRTIEGGAMDFATDFAAPLPMLVIAEMIGVAAADWPRFLRWSEVILRLSHTIRGMESAEAAAASADYWVVTAEMKSYVTEIVAQRASTPPPDADLLSRLLDAEEDGQRLSTDDIVAFLQLLLVAGSETTTNLLNNALLCFIEHPQQLARLYETQQLLPAAIEEVLRYRSPVQWMFRGTRRDVELHGVRIPAGKLVLPIIGSANRDPLRFIAPERFDIARNPNAHIAFGHGIHFCLGAPLSRLEARIALADVLERLTDFQLASDQPWEPRRALHVHGPTHLPIRFRPGTASIAATR